MTFGQYGREEASMVLIYQDDELTVKTLKWTASLEAGTNFNHCLAKASAWACGLNYDLVVRVLR